MCDICDFTGIIQQARYRFFTKENVLLMCIKCFSFINKFVTNSLQIRAYQNIKNSQDTSVPNSAQQKLPHDNEWRRHQDNNGLVSYTSSSCLCYGSCWVCVMDYAVWLHTSFTTLMYQPMAFLVKCQAYKGGPMMKIIFMENGCLMIHKSIG